MDNSMEDIMSTDHIALATEALTAEGPDAVMTLSLTAADLDAIRQVVAEEISRNNVALHGDLDDPTDGPLDQAALRRHGDAVDLVRQDTQAHCMACGHKGEVAP